MTAQAYDKSMTTRITVSLPDHLVADARRAVDSGEASSVSAYVASALEATRSKQSLKDLLDEWDRELGPPGPEAVARVDEQMRRLGWKTD